MAKNIKKFLIDFPEIAKQWHPTKNGSTTPANVAAGSNTRYWWICDKGPDHEWQAPVANRTINKSGCPCCDGKKVSVTNSLASLFPEVASQWHPTKNGSTKPEDVVAGSGKTYWWMCNKGPDHEWPARVAERTFNKRGCPFCDGKRVSVTNSLASLFPEVAKQWHPTKNGSTTPDKVVAMSHAKYWWKCNKGPDHEWRAITKDRTGKGSGCPFCDGKKVSVTNSLASLFPEVAKQWHPTKNGSTTPDKVVAMSHAKYWWKCNKGPDHEWPTQVANRTFNKSGCPFCTIVPQSREELSILFELKSIFPDIDPQGRKFKINGNVLRVDIYIEELNLVIEYDGNFYHMGKERGDKEKARKLKLQGYQVLRIRQDPLVRLFPDDLVVSKRFNAKIITNKILKVLRKKYPLPSNKQNRINKYLSSDKLRNSLSMDRYIDSILSEKLKKKREVRP